MADTITESSPLLGGQIRAESAVGGGGTSDQQEQPVECFPRALKTLTKTTFILYSAVFVLLIATLIMHFIMFGPYEQAEKLCGVAFVIFLAALSPLLNLKIRIPVLLNVIIDVAILYFSLLALDWVPPPRDYLCYKRDSDSHRSKERPGCKNTVFAMNIILTIAGFLFFIAWLGQLALLIIRLITLWKRNISTVIGVPAGELSLTLSIKFHKQQQGPPAAAVREQENV